MRSDQPLVSRVASDVLTGYYKRKRLTQEELADRTGLPLTSLQKKLRGTAPVSATDLVVISRAIGVRATTVMDEILSELEERERLESEAVTNISDHRRKKTPAEMTEEEMEGVPNAANTDPEHERDEPDPT